MTKVFYTSGDPLFHNACSNVCCYCKEAKNGGLKICKRLNEMSEVMNVII